MSSLDEDIYLSIKEESSGLYKEKGSKFLSFAFPVATEDYIKGHLTDLRKKYFDARHHCYAYALGKNQHIYRANDDGEPNHSAGDPILGQIRSKGISDVLVVVIRYFGGTKLGVGGLITAYKTATQEALDQAELVEKLVTEDAEFLFTYEVMNEVMRIVKEYEPQVHNQEFNLQCRLKLRMRSKQAPIITEKLLKAGCTLAD
ncbi:YigZ family protein [Cytophagales bacterium LB-30]|uniref:YigZ family protein n=1 Tax=Shiella aurantiaca TaxID=3058365 RepID=A0ABT8F8X2_9BACT|nr:YigZ family protein [Shiella aurantiaca]MDN4166921.1 YigZ family protein [Shiella aurantiaca]